jgi:hypothetical protein
VPGRVVPRYQPEGRQILARGEIEPGVHSSSAGPQGGPQTTVTDNRNVGDFTRWKEHDAYQKALERLLRDLKVEAS